MASAEGYLLGLWIHECQRVFADRLIVEDEKLWVQKAIFDICKQVISMVSTSYSHDIQIC